MGDAFDPATSPVPVPDPLPDDCAGHGTHVAGILGANGGVVGVAPEVTFGVYRVFGCNGDTFTDIMLAAMERIAEDGADVVNISIGAPFQWPQYPTAQAADRLVNKGIVVVTSTGNSGANGVYAAGAPGVGSKVIATASFNNTTLKTPAFTLSPDNKLITYTRSNGARPAPTSGTAILARTGTTTTENDACDPVAPPAGSLTGKVALIRRGNCDFHIKVRNAQAAGAIGVVLYNNQAAAVTPNVGGAVPITIPVVIINQTDGALVDSRIAAGGPVELTWGKFLSQNITSGNLIASSSSYGMAADLTLKPDIGAPGGSIFSTYPLENGGYYQQQRHVHGLAARGGRRRPAAGGPPPHLAAGGALAPAEQRLAPALGRQSRPRPARQRAPSGRRHLADRGRPPGHRGRAAGQALPG